MGYLLKLKILIEYLLFELYCGVNCDNFIFEAKKKGTPKPSDSPMPTFRTDPFYYVKKSRIKIDKDSDMAKTAISWYDLMQTLAVLGIFITISFCGIRYAMAKSAEKRKEVRENLFGKAIIFIVICAFTFFIGWVFDFSKKII